MWLALLINQLCNDGPLVEDVVRVGRNSVPAQAKLSFYPAQCHAALLRDPGTL